MGITRKTRRNSKKMKRKTYEFKNEKLAFSLVRFLNENRGSDLADIVRRCAELDDLGGRLDWSEARDTNSDGWLLFETMKDLINLQLNHRYASESAPALFVQGRSRYYFAHTTNAGIDQDELHARAILEEIMSKGLISSLRVCDIDDCKKWFFARKAPQLCCSSTCKQRKYDRSPKARQRRQENRDREKASTLRVASVSARL
jgi:hypothetical protein